MSAQIMALDVGERRIGVALASRAAKLASPLTTLERDDQTIAQLQSLLQTNNVDTLVIGLPRNMAGEDTAQTKAVREFAETLSKSAPIPQVFQDEALTSVKAEEELKSKKRTFEKGDIDKLAATYILEDYLNAI